MYELTLENAAGDQIVFAQNTAFTVTEIKGLNPPKASINTSQVALIDGAVYNSAKLNMRSINIAFAIEYQAAQNRLEVYKVLKSKQYVKLLYVSQTRNVYAEGYIESIDISYGAMKQIVTCAILCPSPYLMAMQEMVAELRSIVNAFHFPFASTAEPELLFSYISNDIGVTIDNNGDVSCGLIIELYANAEITNPKIFDYVTQDFFGLNYTMQEADLITIDTRKGHKTVTLLRNGVETNIFNYVMQNSTWLQLDANGSTFVYEVGTGDEAELDVTFRYNALFEGV